MPVELGSVFSKKHNPFYYTAYLTALLILLYQKDKENG